MDSQVPAGMHGGRGSRLAPIVTHQGHPLFLRPLRELAVDRHVQRREPLASGTLAAGMEADDRLGGPIESHHDRDPAEALDQHLGHIEGPPLVRCGGLGFAPRWRSFGFEPQVRLDQEMRLPHPVHQSLVTQGH
jgi:hypothetical protein